VICITSFLARKLRWSNNAKTVDSRDFTMIWKGNTQETKQNLHHDCVAEIHRTSMGFCTQIAGSVHRFVFRTVAMAFLVENVSKFVKNRGSKSVDRCCIHKDCVQLSYNFQNWGNIDNFPWYSARERQLGKNQNTAVAEHDFLIDKTSSSTCHVACIGDDHRLLKLHVIAHLHETTNFLLKICIGGRTGVSKQGYGFEGPDSCLEVIKVTGVDQSVGK